MMVEPGHASNRSWHRGARALHVLIRGRAKFIVVTTIGALTAFALSSHLGIAHPYWSAMAFWIVLQPTRTLFYQRLARRLVGTLLGAATGYALLTGLPGRSGIILACMSVLCASAAGLGVVLRQHRSYALLLTGYTACIVVVSGIMASGDSWVIAGSRMASAVIGVACALVAGLIAIQQQDPRYLSRKLFEAAADAHALAARIANLGFVPSDQDMVGFLKHLGALQAEAEREPIGARSHGDALAWTQQLLEGALQLQSEVSRSKDRAELAPALQAVAAQLEREKEGTVVPDASALMTGLTGSQAMIDALTGFTTQAKAPVTYPAGRHPLMPAVRVAARTFLCLGVVSTVWLLTGWSYGGASVIATAIFITLFSGHDDPAMSSAGALKATAVGVALALFHSIAIAPHLFSLAGEVIGLSPFMALAATAISRPSTSKLGLDAVLAFLLVVEPQASRSAGALVAFWSAGATLLGMGVAAVAYRYLLPAHPQRRADAIIRRVSIPSNTLLNAASHKKIDRKLDDLVTLGRLAAGSGARLPRHLVADVLLS